MVDYQSIAEDKQRLLLNNREWETKYAGYIIRIKNSNKEDAKKKLMYYNICSPLDEYTTIGNEESPSKSLTTILRYKGQSVAMLIPSESRVEIKITSEQALGNQRFPYDDQNIKELLTTPKSFDWHSEKGIAFRRYFRNNPEKTNNREHTLESILLTELEKTNAQGKSLTNIQPVRIQMCVGNSHKRYKRFQLPTAFSASKRCESTVATGRGGGIDILARRGLGRNCHLVVIELKDENQPSESLEIAMKQALTYSVFLRELLRSEVARNNEWYHLFGFDSDVPSSLFLQCAVAMPDIADVNIFKENKINEVHLGSDLITLHCISVDLLKGKIVQCSDGF